MVGLTVEETCSSGVKNHFNLLLLKWYCFYEQDSKVSKRCAVLIELETLRNTKELSVFNDVFSLWTNGL